MSAPREPKAVKQARDVHVNILLLANRSLDQLEEICRSEDLTHSQYVALWTLCLGVDADKGMPVCCSFKAPSTAAGSTTCTVRDGVW